MRLPEKKLEPELNPSAAVARAVWASVCPASQAVLPDRPLHSSFLPDYPKGGRAGIPA